MDDCVFCKIRDGQIPSKFVYDDEKCVAFPDMRPQDRIHYLIVPRKHIATVADITSEDEPLLGHMLVVAKNLAKKENLKGYRLQFNVGKSAGQEVFHVHLHLVGH